MNNTLEKNFIEAEPGTLWKMKEILENKLVFIPLWINPETDERIGADAFWSDHGHFMKLGKTVIKQNTGSKFEKVMFYSKERNEVVIGYMLQHKHKLLRPYFREEYE